MYPVREDMPFYLGLLALRVFGYYPSSKTNKPFLGFAYLLSAIWSTNLINFGISFIVGFSNNNDGAPEDLANFVCMFGCMFTTVLFATHCREWSDLFESLAAYHRFGKPPKYDRVKKYGDILMRVWICYVALTSIVIIVAVLLTEERCEKKYNGGRACWLVFPVSWISQTEVSLLAKRLLLAFQIVSAINYAQYFVVILLVYQAVELICARVDHMSDLFTELCSTINIETQNHRFKLWIQYHEESLRLCGRLNHLSKRTIGHIFLTVTVTVACFAYQLQKDPKPVSMSCILAFYGITFVTCHSGQILEDKMMSIGDITYLNQWSMLNQSIQKLLPLIIARSQCKVGMDVLPIGKANYLSFVMALKTTYSYLTLLNNFAED